MPLSLTNAAWFEPEVDLHHPQDSQRLTVGYLGRPDREKGFHGLVELVGRVDESPRLVCAGPTAADCEDPLVECLGPIYSVEEKRNFFRPVDVLAFPTRAPQETEGIVVLEALTMGTPVLMFNNGCLPARTAESPAIVVVETWEEFETALLETDWSSLRSEASALSLQLSETGQSELEHLGRVMAW